MFRATFEEPITRPAAFCTGENGNGNINQRTVLPHSNGIEMFYPLASPDALNNHCFFASALGWNYQSNVLANCFFRGVAEQTFRTLIPTRDNAIEVLADDRADRLEETTTCAASLAQALPREVSRGRNPNDRSPSYRTDCAALPAQPVAPQKPKPDADGIIWHKRPGYPNQEMSEPDSQGVVMYKIHMTTAAPPLPSRETDARRAQI